MSEWTWQKIQQRGIPIAQRGMVATASPLASASGLQILREGGNAADAAVAAAATLGVTLGNTNSMGGDMFCLYYDAKTRSVTGFNGNGAAGSLATLEHLHSLGLKHMPERGPLTVTVPGAVDGYCELSRRFGSMPLNRLLADAIHYAGEGHPITQNTSRVIPTIARQYPDEVEWHKIFTPDGRVPKAGDILVQPDYAWTLRQVAEGGRDAFYEGEVAKRIVRALEPRGGLLTEADFKSHHTEVYTPITSTYRGLTVHETQPPSQGFLVLEMLNLVEPEELGAMGWGSAAAIHQMVEAKKLAFLDRWEHMGDPRFVRVPTEKLISKAYAHERRRAIDPNHAMEAAPSGLPVEFAADTTYLCAVDGEGNGASLIHTVFHPYGSVVVAGGTGLVLTNRGRAFSLDEGHPNAIAPGKRTMHTLNAYILTDGDELVILGGTQGADHQPQWNVQVLTGMLDFGLNVQQTAEQPRWISTPGTIPSEIGKPYELELEEGFDPAVYRQLEQLGHKVVRRPQNAFGSSVQVIRRDPETGALWGGSDPRADGLAVGF
jgi:gamma-glutamyltranspeptidase/glutathione hydrolase